MTVIAGPWGMTPVVQLLSLEVAQRIDGYDLWNGYDEASHRPRADSCPDVCHACPLLKNPDGKFDVMPSCMGGAISNNLEDCHCDPLDRIPTSGMRAK